MTTRHLPTSSGDHEIFQPQHQRSVGMMASWLAQILPYSIVGSKPIKTKIYTGPACVKVLYRGTKIVLILF